MPRNALCEVYYRRKTEASKSSPRARVCRVSEMPRRSVLRVLLVALIYLCILIVTAEIDNVPTATCTEGESGGQVILSGIMQYW